MSVKTRFFLVLRTSRLPSTTKSPADLSLKVAVVIPSQVTVSDGVVAFWKGADEPGCDLDALPKDGKLDWVCSMPAQGKLNLVLQWEVTTPLKADVLGF